jgi:hypothetical protein
MDFGHCALNTDTIERARADYRAALARPPKYPNGPGAQQRAQQRLIALPQPRTE